jgi:hypothetical protein
MQESNDNTFLDNLYKLDIVLSELPHNETFKKSLKNIMKLAQNKTAKRWFDRFFDARNPGIDQQRR